MQIKALKGMKDVLPEKVELWQYIENIMRYYAKLYGYNEIRTPVVERTELFSRGVGDSTDIVQKEMYTFKDKGGRSITLKPEGTAGVVRAFLEGNLYADTLPCKLYYINNPIFRYEAPQSGRLREHHQFGVECFGSKSPSLDAEIISLGFHLLETFELKNVRVQINSIGCEKCRPNYIKTLKEFLNTKKEFLCPDCLNRIEKNPLRVLDCKIDSCQNAIIEAPSTLNMLCEECYDHFENLKSYLIKTNIPFDINQKIVRGLDYYTKTVFEFVQSTDNGFLTVCGGGRYDNLISELGGSYTPAVGFGMGMERLIMLMPQEAKTNTNGPDIFVCNLSKENFEYSFAIIQKLRENGIVAELDHNGRSVKGQFKYANKLNAKNVLIVGGDELSRNMFKLKNMETGKEEEISIDGFEITIKNKL
ncbi:MAG: histidine--tRNA ligase [Christensenellaceae bacterium]|nr:histidine--tRNA ligase [Christensenellaceae bacterium]